MFEDIIPIEKNTERKEKPNMERCQHLLIPKLCQHFEPAYHGSVNCKHFGDLSGYCYKDVKNV